MTRNPLVSVVLLAVALTIGWPAAQAARVPFVYVSGYRPEIAIFRLDAAGGKLIPAGKAVDVGQEPSFLAFDPAAKFLFAVNETDPGRVRSFAINQTTGALTPINDVPAMGSITAHLSTDRTGRWLLVANYGDQKQGTIASFPIGVDGRLGTAVDTREFGLGTMAHYISADPGNRFVFVPLKGGPSVAQLVFDAATGRMKPNLPAQAPAARDAGPRHLDFHPNGRFAYVINELDLTMTAYAYDATAGFLRELQILPTLPAAADKVGASGAEVHVHQLRSLPLRLESRTQQHRHLSPRRRWTHDPRRPRVARYPASAQLHHRSDRHDDARGQPGRRKRDDVPDRSDQGDIGAGGTPTPVGANPRSLEW